MLRLTIIGYGNQARSWAQNLKDSGSRVRIALRSGSHSEKLARSQGHDVVVIGSLEFFDDTAYALLTPDDTHGNFLKEFGSSFKNGSVMVYAHGYSCLENRFHERYPGLRHVLFAPKAIGTELRRQFLSKGKLGAVYSLEFVEGSNPVLEPWIRQLAQGLGINLGPFATTFRHETEADLYSEQGLLCSLVPYAAAEMFAHLREKGIEPELAYFECWHELKLIVNAMVEMGPLGFYDLISPNALIGSEKGRERLITPEFRKNLRSLLEEIQSGDFNAEVRATDLKAVRERVRSRWETEPLTKTFRDLNQETP